MKSLIKDCNFYNFDEPLLFLGAEKKHLIKGFDVVVQGVDVLPKGTLKRILELIDKGYKIELDENGAIIITPPVIFSDCQVGHVPNNGFHR